MSQEQVACLVSPQELVSQANLTLQERVENFNNKFPQNKINRYYLKKVFKTFGVTRKVPLTWNCNFRKYDLEKLSQLRLELHKKMTRYERMGYEVL